MELGCKPSNVDPDIWMKPKVKTNGDESYSMILVYVDDVLYFDHEPGKLMKDLEKLYWLKDKAETPDRYLGANIDKVQLSDGDVRWSMSSREYLTSAINNLDTELEKEKWAPLRTNGKRAGKRPFS